jgi:carbonic anhydrase
MHRLLHGIQRFHRDEFPARRERYEELASGQQPTALFITCSDSRIVPHLLTQTEPGELFVLRNAGNLVPPYTAPHTGEAATVEYAVKVLKVQDIVVCGHSHCGAISGLMRPESLHSLPAVQNWLLHAERVREEITRQRLSTSNGHEDELTAAIQANVLVQLDHLHTYPAILEAMAEGALHVHGCFYRFETGEVTVFDQAIGRFVSIEERTAAELSA